jgi:hypothetical protein
MTLEGFYWSHLSRYAHAAFQKTLPEALTLCSPSPTVGGVLGPYPSDAKATLALNASIGRRADDASDGSRCPVST